MNKYAYLIWFGFYYNSGWVTSVYDKRIDAIKQIKKAGFKYNKRQNLYLLENSRSWYKIEKVKRNILIYEEW